jgi:hypothetical protein
MPPENAVARSGRWPRPGRLPVGTVVGAVRLVEAEHGEEAVVNVPSGEADQQRVVVSAAHQFGPRAVGSVELAARSRDDDGHGAPAGGVGQGDPPGHQPGTAALPTTDRGDAPLIIGAGDGGAPADGSLGNDGPPVIGAGCGEA